MDSILAWNVRGVNYPNYQEDISIFLRNKKVGFMELHETNIKKEKEKMMISMVLEDGMCNLISTFITLGG